MSNLDFLGEAVTLPTDAPEPAGAPAVPAAPAEAPAAPAEAPAAPAEAPAAPAAAEPTHSAERFVPIQALHEARERNRELAARLATAEQRDREQRQAAAAPAAPAFEENPAGHLKHQVETIAQRLEAQQTQQHQERVVQQLTHRVMNDEQAFTAANPDYGQALGFMADVRVKELVATGMDPSSAQQRAAFELNEFAFVTAAKGGSPASIAYNIAKAKGYQKAAAAAPAAAPVPPAEKFANQQHGAAAARSLGGGGSAAPPVSIQALLSMSDDDFAEATKGPKWAKVMGE